MKTKEDLRKILATSMKIIPVCEEGYVIEQRDENGDRIEHAIYRDDVIAVYVESDFTLHMQCSKNWLKDPQLKILRTMFTRNLIGDFVFIKEHPGSKLDAEAAAITAEALRSID